MKNDGTLTMGLLLLTNGLPHTPRGAERLPTLLGARRCVEE